MKFPQDFIWGSATSSYQIEGAVQEGGKGPSIWDAFSHIPGKTLNGDTGDIACDHYHKMEEDVAMMAKMGLKAYRFSIAWPRIQPDGQGKSNPEGIAFYSRLIDALLSHGIEPWITLYHWDLPIALEMEHDGWRNPRMADFFRRYAEICFEHFGDRVKNWITLNEPWVVAICGYGLGVFAPGRKSQDEPYLVGHNLLRAHAYTVDTYRQKFQPDQGGRIGISNNCDWREPYSDSEADRQAAQRAVEFFLGWFADPVFLGDYPAVMRERLGERLPAFSPEDAKMIKGSSDYFGLNHYTTHYAAYSKGGIDSGQAQDNGGMVEDQDIVLRSDPAWKKTDMGWNVVPWGCQKLLEWIHNRYGAPEIILTENGCAYDDEPVNGVVNDTRRINYYREYIKACHAALENGVNLKGYFAWSLLDNFEWSFGYGKRFGLTHIDYKTLVRTPKNSFLWYRDVIVKNGI
jgi:beta-glucosidase